MGVFQEGLEAGVHFYDDPENLAPEQVDPLLRDAVARINRSGWVWTAESCQGHPDETGYVWAGNTSPMLRLVCRTPEVGRMLGALHEASTGFVDEDGLPRYFSLRVHPQTLQGWAEVLVYVEARTVSERDLGIAVLDRLAELVTPAP